jgi:MFS family permease
MSNQFQLLKELRFRPLFLTQFLGAFNDNVFKTALVTLVVFRTNQLTSIDATTMATILPGLFILPFFLFSATAGNIADKFEKSQVIRIVKAFEIIIMLFASIGFLMHNMLFLAGALFMMGVQSAFFGPVKYAYLPQQLHKDELVGGNGMIETGTFIAILFGQILGAWLAMQNNSELLISLCIVALALIGYWISRDTPATLPGDPELVISWNIFRQTFYNLTFIWQRQSLWIAIIGISWFWFFGATLLAQLPNFAKFTLYGDESVFILMLSIFSLGIGIGSLLCEKLSHHRVELGLVLFGGMGITLFGIDLYVTSTNLSILTAPKLAYSYIHFLFSLSHLHLLLDILLIGIFGGLYIVPLYAFIQRPLEKSHQSRIIAANNIMNALFMVVSALFSLCIFSLDFNIPQLFLATSSLSAIVMAYLCIRQPAFLSHFLVWASISKHE